jgi:hypothetical protein
MKTEKRFDTRFFLKKQVSAQLPNDISQKQTEITSTNLLTRPTLNDVHTQLDVNMPSLLTSKNQQLDS